MYKWQLSLIVIILLNAFFIVHRGACLRGRLGSSSA